MRKEVVPQKSYFSLGQIFS